MLLGTREVLVQNNILFNYTPAIIQKNLLSDMQHGRKYLYSISNTGTTTKVIPIKKYNTKHPQILSNMYQTQVKPNPNSFHAVRPVDLQYLKRATSKEFITVKHKAHKYTQTKKQHATNKITTTPRQKYGWHCNILLVYILTFHF